NMDAGSSFGSIFQVFFSVLAGALGWVALEFVGRPLRRFFDLRGETIRRLAESNNILSRYRHARDDVGATAGLLEMDLPEDELARSKEAVRTIRDLASQMRAFAMNETMALSIAKRLGYDAAKASRGLFGLSNSFETAGQDKNFQRMTIADALKI